MIATRGALLFFLPPYSPQLNPIEVGFSLVKRWIEKKAHLVFHQTPELALDLAFRKCACRGEIALNLFSHCGYGDQSELEGESLTINRNEIKKFTLDPYGQYPLRRSQTRNRHCHYRRESLPFH